MNVQSSENILLIGAGFTKNFGTLLASEMWAEIFSHEKIQAQPKIKELMLDDFDYESIYYSIIEGSFSDEEKKAIKDAVKFAYEYIDAILMEHITNHPYPNSLHNVTDFIHRFGETNHKSFIFSLNQDLFFERLYHNHYIKLSIPGIDNKSEWFDTSRFTKPLTATDYCQLPKEDELNPDADILLEGDHFLIKLHGSYNWTSFDGSDAMVIGRGKTEQIQKEPLLKCYFDIFETVLSQGQRRLFIIGYGFGDYHINRMISNAMKDYELKIYIISPDSPEKFKKKLCEKSSTTINIWQGMSGYFQYALKDIFPEDMDKNQAIKKHFCDVFFGAD